jgi:hypothetical protein
VVTEAWPPTRLTEAGAGAGLFAGNEGAFIHAFYREDAAPSSRPGTHVAFC